MTGPDPTHFYRCPNGHEWWTTEREAPLVNIKCPDCQVTAVRYERAVPLSQWPVRESAKLEADFTHPEFGDKPGKSRKERCQ